MDDNSKKLSDLLDAERSAIVSGKKDLILQAISQHETVQYSLQDMCSSPFEVEVLRQKAQRNSKLISASLSGLRYAAKTISAAQAATSELSVYDWRGRRSSFDGMTTGSKNKRV